MSLSRVSSRLVVILACLTSFASVDAAAASAGAARAHPALSPRADTVVLWHTFHDAEEQAIKVIALAYNLEHRDQLVPVQMPHDGFGAMLERSILAGRGPDLFIWAHDKAGEWAKEGLLAPFDRLIDSTVRGEFFPNCLDALSVKGRLQGLPLSFETLILYYNRALVSRPPVNTDEFIRLGRSRTNRANGRYGLVYERGNFYHHAMWLHGFGGSLFDDRGEFTVTSPEMRRSLEFARDLATTHGMIPDTVDWKMQMKLFNEGRAAMMISGPWAYGSIDSKIDFGMTILPFITESQRWAAPFLGVKGIFMNARSPRRRAAVDAALFATSGYACATMNILAGSLPANRRAYENGLVAADRLTAAFKEQILYAVPMPSNDVMQHIWTVMMADPATLKPGCLDRVFLYGIAPDSACAFADREYRRIVRGGRIAR